MGREVKVGDTIYVTKISQAVLDVPHEVKVVEIYTTSDDEMHLIQISPPIGESVLMYPENNYVDEWYFEPPTIDDDSQKDGIGYTDKEFNVGDNIYVTKVNGDDIIPPLVRTIHGMEINEDGDLEIDLNTDINRETLLIDNGTDEWYSLERPKVGDNVLVKNNIYGEELDPPRLATVSKVDKRLGAFSVKEVSDGKIYLLHFDKPNEWEYVSDDEHNSSSQYDDDAISPSYSEAVRAGKTFADYTGAHITEKSLDFKTKEDEIIEGITAESLNFQEVESDNVNHPSHYNYGDIEVIDFIEQVTSQYEDGFDAYIVGNALKYLARSPHKNGDEDLKKAHWYLSRLLKRNEDE